MARTLADLAPGQEGVVADYSGDDAVVQRLLAMGLTEGETVALLRTAPLGDPMELRVRGYNLSLRRAEAAAVRLQ